ncbi:MAG TPA: VWA domain-containing protein [Planctomycetota bacterium]|nr:VWA domain-containing protein [Planctomycetota bacterium]
MHRRILATLLLLAPLGITDDAPAQGSDLALVIDLSSSMRKNDALLRGRRLLQGLLEEAVGPGSQVAIVPFGEGVHEILRFTAANDERGAAEVRSKVDAALEDLKARDSYSYLGAAIDAGIEELKRFKGLRPDRARHLVLVTDGPQTVARGDPAPALPDVIAAWDAKGMKAPDDWFLWYTHFGDPDEALATAITNSGAGRQIALDSLDDLTWTFTRIEMKKTNLGAKGGTSWTALVPFVARSGGGAAGRRLRLSVGGTLPPGMTVTVSPREMALVGRSTEIDLQLICTGARSGSYSDLAVLVEGVGLLHWAEPRRIPLRFSVGEPRITVKQPRVDLGRVAPGKTATGQVALVPNEDAAASPPNVSFTVTRAPAGVKVEPAKAEAAAGELALGFTVSVPDDAREGTAECRLRLDAGDTALSVPELRVVFQVAPPRVSVAGALKLEAAAGEDATGELTLAPDAAAAALAPEVRASVQKELPKGLVVESPAVVAKGQTPLPVRVRVAGDVPEGEYKTTLSIAARGVKVDPSVVTLSVHVVRPQEPPLLRLPASLDLGDVPKDHAAELTGSFPLELPSGFDGTDLVLESGGSAKIVSEPTPLATGPNDVTFRLKPASLEPGEQIEFVRVLARRGRRAREAGMIALRWRITDGKLTVREVKSPEPLPFHGGTVQASLALQASDDLKDNEVTLKLSFDKLPEGMAATLPPTKVKLTGGTQVVPMSVEVTGARPGAYRGTVEIALESGLVLASAQFPVVVRPLAVAVQVDGSLEGLADGADGAVTLILTVEDAIVQTVDLGVDIDRDGLPEGVSIQTLKTVSLRRAGEARIPVRFHVSPESGPGTWHPSITLSAPEGVVLDRPRIDLAVTVPVHAVVTASVAQPTESRKSFWGILGLVALALTAVAALYVGRSKDDLLLQING